LFVVGTLVTAATVPSNSAFGAEGFCSTWAAELDLPLLEDEKSLRHASHPTTMHSRPTASHGARRQRALGLGRWPEKKFV
ncbi:MAG TPA: hypothetical protein VNT99_02570, partial [Methylomirabilota bacterium]|nr:hypothetical protein [Methylomirabilota bacterium]